MWNLILKMIQMNSFTKQKQTYRLSKTNLSLPKGKHGGVGRDDKSGAWDEHTHTTIHKIDDQQGPAV